MKHVLRTSKKFAQTFAMVALISGIMGVSACTPRVQSIGNELDPERLSEITVGEHTRLDVEEILGSPSSMATFGQETWYYVSEKLESKAFFAAEVVDRAVTIIRFDETGSVAEITNLSQLDARNIEPVDRQTPTAGNELTFIEQMMANLGRFNRKK